MFRIDTIDPELKAVARSVPITALTGFLGAGTTPLDRILNGDHGLRVAVPVNGFGSINIDSDLVVGDYAVLDRIFSRLGQRQTWLCGMTLARVHAKSGQESMISGYLGQSDTFDGASGLFAVACAEHNERDHAKFGAAVRAGRIEALIEENL